MPRSLRSPPIDKPATADDHYKQGILRYNEGALNEALDHFGKALALESRGELEGAVTIYGQLRSETDSEDAIHVQAALAETRALQELGRNDEAVAVLESMLVGASPEVRQEIENRLQTLQALRP